MLLFFENYFTKNPKIMVRLQELSEEITNTIEEINSEQELLNIIKRNGTRS